MISVIVAASENNVIGINNQLPWKLPDDFKFFKNTTYGFPIIMGRKTWESLGGKPLKGRHNIVITRQEDYAAEGVTITNSLAGALAIAERDDVKEIFVIGGMEIIRQAWNQVDRIYLTRVHGTFEGDAFFPDVNPAEWKRVHAEEHPADDRHAYAFTFETWERI
ncbi:dihydrofolate reductase [Chitinophaga deserti]|uniref:dihydrofolate reductase n=1 Tax=Chitinophaga deserti TaxID=2164099 RepID=UPI000D6BC91F|nr:dihydrofolate reductase [Chitinophaga deserti]